MRSDERARNIIASLQSEGIMFSLEPDQKKRAIKIVKYHLECFCYYGDCGRNLTRRASNENEVM